MRRNRTFADRQTVAWADSRCLLLTTNRRDGTPVASPVWFVTCHGELWLWTGATTGKVKRLRHDPTCTVAPCTMRGRPTGATTTGRARLLAAHDAANARHLIRAKYPIQKRALDAYGYLRRRGRATDKSISIYLAITLES